ncbi:MAG: LysR family transcriptional regulator [Planctomycetes bacterium RBG_16_64_10]|nr:MAG: LysR family transcriptional regulator [Planctomycetes bacterium RBG_16_64_10]
MDWLNYHHLLYFWAVAREGSIARACERLHLTQPTISSQLRKLEKSAGGKLFQRVGRNLVLTETGQLVLRYADEIFALGQELTQVLHGRPSGSPIRFLVGVVDVVPKLIAYRLLEAALQLSEPIQLTCEEGNFAYLLTELAAHRLDVVLSDSALGATVNVRAYNHLLGECSVSIFGAAELARKFRRGFPQSLDGAPILLPMRDTALRRLLDQWCDSRGIQPQVVGQFDDSALLNVFGTAGVGLVAAPSAIQREICRQYRVHLVGELPEVRERYYAISSERRLKHPAVVAICETARHELFA